MSKHTPGPWALRRDPGHFDTLTEITGGLCGNTKPFRFTLEVSVGGDADINTLEANASLIAAAPNLLKELEELLEYVMCKFGMPDDHVYAVAARAAIAKAKGEV